jgi:hypothetical protein
MNYMTMRNALLAACAGALVLTATLAHAGEPIPGVDIELGCNPYPCGGGKPKATSGRTKPAANQKTFFDGDASFGRSGGGQARRGSKISDNDSPRPTDRIFISPGPGGGPQRR